MINNRNPMDLDRISRLRPRLNCTGIIFNNLNLYIFI